MISEYEKQRYILRRSWRLEGSAWFMNHYIGQLIRLLLMTLLECANSGRVPLAMQYCYRSTHYSMSALMLASVGAHIVIGVEHSGDVLSKVPVQHCLDVVSMIDCINKQTNKQAFQIFVYGGYHA